MNFKRIKEKGKMWEYVWQPIVLFVAAMGSMAFALWRRVAYDETNYWALLIGLAACVYFKLKNNKLNGPLPPAF